MSKVLVRLLSTMPFPLVDGVSPIPPLKARSPSLPDGRFCRLEDGSRLQAYFYHSDKEVYKQLDEEIGRLFDEEAERQGLDIP